MYRVYEAFPPYGGVTVSYYFSEPCYYYRVVAITATNQTARTLVLYSFQNTLKRFGLKMD